MRYLILFLSISFLLSCAKIVAPTGGPLDETPPSIVSVSPSSGTTDLKSGRIEMLFDEYIQTIDPSLIVISPFQTEKPEYVLSGKKLFIELKEELYENTTYTIKFNNSLRDYTAGNEINNYIYVFSTGKELDTLTISGNIMDARLGDWDPELENVNVILHPADIDSAFTSQAPFYFTTVDSIGYFQFDNLKEGEYNIYALADQNYNFYYDQQSEQLAFLETTVRPSVVGDSTRQEIELALFQEEIESYYVLSGKNVSEGEGIVTLSKPYGEIQLEYDTADFEDLFFVKSEVSDSIKLWYLPQDSLEKKIFLSENAQPLDTLLLKAFELGDFHHNFKFNAKKQVPVEDSVGFRFPFPIRAIDNSKIELRGDSLLVSCEMLIQEDEPLNTHLDFVSIDSLKYELTILPGALENIYNEPNADTLRHNFSFVPREIMGELSIEFSGVENENYIYELFNDRGVVKSGKLEIGKTNIGELSSGSYQVRIITDTNNNGHWDSGKLSEGRLPEKVRLIQEPINVQARFANNAIIEF